MTKEKTIAATAILGCESEAEIDFLIDYAKDMGDDVKILRQRQLAGNWFELEVFCQDITDIYLFGCALGKAFPGRNSKKYSGELVEDEN